MPTGFDDLSMCREDADAEFLNTVAAAIGDASPGALTFLTGGCASPPGRHHKSVEKVFLLSGPKGEARWFCEGIYFYARLHACDASTGWNLCSTCLQ